MPGTTTRRVALFVSLVTAATASGQGPPRYVKPGAPVPARRAGPVVLSPGFHARVRVLAPTRFDPTYVVAPEAKPKKEGEWAADPGRPYYQLFVPRGYTPRTPHAVVVWISPSKEPAEFKAWEGLCGKYGVIFAAPYEAGDDCMPSQRVRIVLDVLDDLRRRLRVDTDRMYLAGQGGGAATACATAFALPELVGGAVAVSGGGPPRPEPWLRDRARERLSVAFVTGEKDPRRGEVERWRHPPVRDGGIRAQVWVSRALPAPAELEAAYLWLEAGVPQRWRLASAYPASRLAEFSTPTAGEWSLTLLREAAARLRRPDTRDSGLMQLHGVTTRWPSSAAAAQAEKVLKAHKWQEVYQAAQQRAAYHQARATTAYLAGPLDEAEARRKKELLRAALADWSRVLEHGKDTDMGKEARGKVDGLKRLLGEGD